MLAFGGRKKIDVSDGLKYRLSYGVDLMLLDSKMDKLGCSSGRIYTAWNKARLNRP
jgi:hypothetical protein